MDSFFTILSLLPFLYGAYLCGDFCLWRFGGEMTEGEIIRFQDKKNKFMTLPVLRVVQKDGKQIEYPANRIDEIGYILSPAQDGEVKQILIKGGRAVIFGYMPLVFGVLLLLPFLFVLGMTAQKTVFVVQMVYLLIFAVVSIGGWMFLKFIQRFDG